MHIVPFGRITPDEAGRDEGCHMLHGHLLPFLVLWVEVFVRLSWGLVDHVEGIFLGICHLNYHDDIADGKVHRFYWGISGGIV